MTINESMNERCMEAFIIRHESDIVRARQAARNLAASLGFSLMNVTRVATAVSELARNTLEHGQGGMMRMESIGHEGRTGIRCVFIDEGPGIPDIDLALRDGFSTGKGLGQGLPGSKRLMDEMKIESAVDQGTTIEVIKWK